MQKYYIQTEPYEDQLTGSLWTATSHERWTFGEREQNSQKFSKPLSVGVCKEISLKEFLLLVAIPDLTLRLEYFRNRKRINDGLAIEVGSRVEIVSSSVMSVEYLASNPSTIILQDSYVGTVLYIGVTGRYDALMFGVRLDDNYEGMGSSSGEFQDDVYFNCKEDCAMFLAAHRLVSLESRGLTVSQTFIGSPDSCSLNVTVPSRRDSIKYDVPADITFSTPTRGLTGSSTVIGSPESSSLDLTHPTRRDSLKYDVPADKTSGSRAPDKEIPLQIGDRIALMQDIGSEYGTVKWIGYLPDDLTKELRAGVEFDNPIGGGTGKYRSVQLFNARMKHAAIVPVLGLVKMVDLESSHGLDDDLVQEDIVSGSAMQDSIKWNVPPNIV